MLHIPRGAVWKSGIRPPPHHLYIQISLCMVPRKRDSTLKAYDKGRAGEVLQINVYSKVDPPDRVFRTEIFKVKKPLVFFKETVS